MRPRIEDYALIGDLLTAALVATDGSVDWLCLPHFDSPACFSAIVDQHESGHWSLSPVGGNVCSSRRYLPNTLVLESTWKTPTGTVRVLDFMPPRNTAPDLVRIVEGVDGSVDMRGELRLRFEYGQVVPWVRRDQQGIIAVAGPNAVYLTTEAPLVGEGLSTVSEFTVRAGQSVAFVMTWAQSHAPRPDEVDAAVALDQTVAFWEEWSSRSTATGAHRDVLQRSLITLKALTFAPTGGIVAAPTTSLPEKIGGSRNWDYRFCWLRDAGLTLQALLGAGYRDEARAWRAWLLRSVAGDPSKLQIMYGLDGRRDLPERELPWLRGYEGSKPVRIGNAAREQLQLDVWGEALDALALTRNSFLEEADDSWDLQKALMNHLVGAWEQPDNGVWEMRGARRHFTYSKVMAWVAADRMVRAVEMHGLDGEVDEWRLMRDRVRETVMRYGFDVESNTFTQSFGSTELDASLLRLGRLGFIEPDDPRMVGTIDAILERLTDDGLVVRYRTEAADDGLPEGEGVFLACSFWMVDALHGIGRRSEAEALFERLLALANDVGLLSEEWDPQANRLLGNMPQAFSHLALVRSALQMGEERIRRSDELSSHFSPS